MIITDKHFPQAKDVKESSFFNRFFINNLIFTTLFNYLFIDNFINISCFPFIIFNHLLEKYISNVLNGKIQLWLVIPAYDIFFIVNFNHV